LAREIAAVDADEFRNQYPAYHADIAGETQKALDALRTDPVHRERYDRRRVVNTEPGSGGSAHGREACGPALPPGGSELEATQRGICGELLSHAISPAITAQPPRERGLGEHPDA
jgi:hypothetical protein